MCDPRHATPRQGARIDDGPAHADDHTWSRRDFLTGIGLAAAAGLVSAAGVPIRTYARSPMLRQLAAIETDRVLVLLQLSGGNDGLNTVVPVGNDAYFNARRTLAIRDALAIGPAYGLHPSLSQLVPLYGDGRLGIVQGVGYPAPSFSHFRATDIWLTADSGDDPAQDGWAGRYLDDAFPDLEPGSAPHPLAIQLGTSSPLLFQGPAAQMGMSIQSMALFEQIASTGNLYGLENLPDGPSGLEATFLRTVANDAFRYAGVIQEAAGGADNRADYPVSTLSEQLAAVARLIRGGLTTRIFHVSLGGFDTHANQLARHADLLNQLGGGLRAFLDDLAADGLDERVLVMTFSEFGRRVAQNGSGGTDHGTAAPLFVAGRGAEGGLVGPDPDLDDLDNGNVTFGTDFRAVYGSILRQWFGMEAAAAASVLGGAYPDLPLVRDSLATGIARTALPTAARLDPPYPNPASDAVTVPFVLDRSATVRLELFDVAGRRVAVRNAGAAPAGRYTVVWPVSDLPPGTYLLRLAADGAATTRSVTVVR